MIIRAPETATQARYDLAVIGGGIYGAALTLEASRRGLRPLLLERGDFGGETSWNSLRIVHGGLRYLQTLDLRRFRESVAERRWFLRHFPDLVKPLPCLMPLYDRGLRRPGVFRAAFLLDRCLSFDRNRGLRTDRYLPAGRLVDAAQTVGFFPMAARIGLRGGALWHDGVMISAPRLLIELLRWAGRCGACTLNYVEAEDLVLRDGRVAGLEATDRLTGTRLRFEAPLVVNCAGPAARWLAARFDRDIPALFRPVLAFNLFLTRNISAKAAVAVMSETGSRNYFLRPWRDGLLVGTGYAPWTDDRAEPRPGLAQIDDFLADLNRAAPALDLRQEQVARIFAGLLPGIREGSDALATRDVLWDHEVQGGPKGLFSLSGIKFTTARASAERLLRRIYRRRDRPLPPYRDEPPPPARPFYSPSVFAQLLKDETAAAMSHIERTVIEESVTCFDDLLLRRLDWPIAAEDEIRSVEEIFRSLAGDRRIGPRNPAPTVP